MVAASVCPIDSRECALAAVAGVADVVRASAHKAEAERGLPVEVVDALVAAGLWGVFSPREVGGGGVGRLVDWYDIVRAMACEDSSAGWALFIGDVSAMLVASRLPPAGRDEVFRAGVTPMVGVFMPGGRARRVDGGMEVTGRWPFASGIGHSPWVMANVIVDDDEVPPGAVPAVDRIYSVVVGRDDVSVIDDWHVAGLQGTGSMSFTIHDLFVPDRRTFPFYGPASIAEPMYRLPLFSLVGPGFAAVAGGLAQRAIDEIVKVLPHRVGPPTFAPASQNQATQRVLGRAIAAVRGAHESTRAILARYDERVASGEDVEQLSLADRSEIHQQVAWAAETFAAVTNDLFRLGGASGIYQSNVVQRCWRDANVLLQHLYVAADIHDTVAKIALGIPVTAPNT